MLLEYTHRVESYSINSYLVLLQGSSNLSVLTDTGAMQAERCRLALSNLNFDQCFSSPISRAKV